MKEKFSTNKLFVGGLPPKLANDDVVEFFNRFGEVSFQLFVSNAILFCRLPCCRHKLLLFELHVVRKWLAAGGSLQFMDTKF